MPSWGRGGPASSLERGCRARAAAPCQGAAPAPGRCHQPVPKQRAAEAGGPRRRKEAPAAPKPAAGLKVSGTRERRRGTGGAQLGGDAGESPKSSLPAAIFGGGQTPAGVMSG